MVPVVKSQHLMSIEMTKQPALWLRRVGAADLSESNRECSKIPPEFG